MDTTKPKRQRSPNYPNYGLRDCVAFIKKIYEKYSAGEVHIDDAVKQAGHSPTSSTAPRVLAALSSFGLTESRGTKSNKFLKLSRLALEILLEEEGSIKSFDLLKQAALNDSSMSAIWAKWETEIPAEDTIRKVLLLEMGYSPDGAARFASVIVDTYDFAQLKSQGEAFSDHGESQLSSEKNVDLYEPLEHDILPPATRKANLLLPGKDRQIIIFAPDDLTEDEFALIFKWLELQKYGLVQDVKTQRDVTKENN